MPEDARDGADWFIDITEACRKRGIQNPYQLWQKIGGSKMTTAKLFGGQMTMITTETMNKLQDLLGITPFEYIKNCKDIR